ncbi:MAG: hypothetical protein Q7R53_03105 [bacterium]|nr:hypothetical protein [bacterium]
MEATLSDLEKRVSQIEERNKRVEKDKAWETGLARRVFITISTYILVVIFLHTIKAEKPFLGAIVPSVAYLISTTSLGILKSWWLEKRRK